MEDKAMHDERWPIERTDRLRELWLAGATAGQIARQLGDVSPAAVIAKARRLGLSSRPSPIRRPSEKDNTHA
jgi:GcrA cell cycle regulator